MSPTDDQVRAAHKALAQLRDHMPRSDWHLDRLAEALPPLPPEPWRPRTKDEIFREWQALGRTGDPNWDIQARTDDIARMVSDRADEVRAIGNPGYSNICYTLTDLAQRIRELE